MKERLRRWMGRLFGLMLVVGLGLMANPAIADPQATSTPSLLASTPALSSAELQPAIDQFLQTIPPGYYGIRQIEALRAKVEQDNALLIDVREISEYNHGHIPGAINIPLRTLAQNLDQVPQDRPVVLYCSSGFRTGMGVMTLRLLGYDNVQGFPPSYNGWKQAQM
jgi:rhodanese-related sulfurtransferase